MLFTPNGTQITRVPHTSDLKAAIQLLGASRTKAVRLALNRLIDEMPPEKSGVRTFSAAQLASQIEPWPYPLAGLYDIALELEGKEATGRQVYDRAGFIFGLFVWESIMKRTEKWVITDQGSTFSDQIREIMEQVYIEQ